MTENEKAPFIGCSQPDTRVKSDYLRIIPIVVILLSIPFLFFFINYIFKASITLPVIIGGFMLWSGAMTGIFYSHHQLMAHRKEMLELCLKQKTLCQTREMEIVFKTHRETMEDKRISLEKDKELCEALKEITCKIMEKTPADKPEEVSLKLEISKQAIKNLLAFKNEVEKLIEDDNK